MRLLRIWDEQDLPFRRPCFQGFPPFCSRFWTIAFLLPFQIFYHFEEAQFSPFSLICCWYTSWKVLFPLASSARSFIFFLSDLYLFIYFCHVLSYLAFFFFFSICFDLQGRYFGGRKSLLWTSLLVSEFWYINMCL